MSPKRLLKIILWILVGLFFIIGIPVLINGAYKYGESYGPIFITLWDAEAALSYYGSVLGAVITGASLFVTIRFTRKQIKRENYVKCETEKWARVEDTIGNILSEINPMPILKQEMDSGFTDFNKALNLLQKYQINCQIATDQLMACINTVDYKRIEDLVNRIRKATDTFFQLSQKKIDQYNKQQQLKRREIAQEFLTMEKKYPGSISTEEITKNQKIISDTNCICMEDIENEMRRINEEFVCIYDTSFRPLLQHKGATFEAISIQIQKTADEILSLQRK